MKYRPIQAPGSTTIPEAETEREMPNFKLSVSQVPDAGNSAFTPGKTLGKITSLWRLCQAVVEGRLCKTLNDKDLVSEGDDFL
jgi:hypothetical protein